MEIALFQLENLCQSLQRFEFFDLRAVRTALPATLERLMQRSVSAKAEEIRSKAQTLDKESPLVLICETGHKSSQLASELEAQGFKNIYIITGGVAGLLSELERD